MPDTNESTHPVNAPAIAKICALTSACEDLDGSEVAS